MEAEIWVIYKPRKLKDADGDQNLEEMWLQREYGPASSFIDHWPPEMLEDKFLLYEVIQFIVICYSRLKN